MENQQQPCFIIGNGPSLNDLDLKLIEGYCSIGINRSYKATESTALIWQDRSFLNECAADIMNRKELKLARSTAYNAKLVDFRFTVSFGGWAETENPLYLSANQYPSTAGVASFFAVAAGFSPLILLGMDCKYRPAEHGLKVVHDFYGVNPNHKAHTLAKCAEALDAVKLFFGDRVISCGDNEIFPKARLEDVVAVMEERGARKQCQELWRSELRETLNKFREEGRARGRNLRQAFE